MQSLNESILVDSGVLYALFDKSDDYHQQALAVFRTNQRPLVCNAAVIIEVTYLLGKWCSSSHQISFLEFLQQPGWSVAELANDLARITEIMQVYSDVPADFADASLVALAERLHCKDILSVDRRGFSVYRPLHTERLRNLFFTIE